MSGATARVADLLAGSAEPELLEHIRAHLESLEPGELLAGLREAYGVASGLMVAGETLGVPTYTMLADLYRRTEAALEAFEAQSTA